MEQKTIKDNKIAFILCVNNQMYFDECCAYLDRLNVPEGYEVEVFPVWDSSSMCQAYNIGMNASDAKYKIYMHQDVFITEKNFLCNIVNIFKENDDIGMIGMTGASELPISGIFFNSYDVGKVEVREQDFPYYYVAGNAHLQLTDVQAVDGMIIITQYDLMWREDLFENFDFYDVSQGLEFKKQGYRVVVPYQNTPWIIHDCSFPNLEKYDSDRQIFIDNYAKYLTYNSKQGFIYNYEIRSLENQLSEIIKKLIELKNWQQVGKLLGEYHRINVKHTELERQCVLYEIYEMEQSDALNTGYSYFFEGENIYSQIVDKYINIRFAMRRYELGWMDDFTSEYEKNLINGNISMPSVFAMFPHAILYRKRFLSRMLSIVSNDNIKRYKTKLDYLLNLTNVDKINTAYGRRYK